ncbi:MAG: HAMP domain-containing sensor histidine kinase, partial [Planctomycetota bacterium]
MEYAALISDGVAGEINDEQRKLLGVVDDRAADLNQMVDDILDASKLESGMLSASRTRVELRDVVDRALPGLEKKAELREVDLVVDIPDDLPAVFCDDEKAGRVLINLAVNAIKFTRGGGKVIIRARTSGEEEVLVEVEDNGIGIPETKLNEIFNRFSQVKPRETSVDMKGFGIGLSIAQELVGLNLGAMQVESREGVGSRFGFTVPINRREVVTRKFLDRLTRLEHAPFVSLFRVKLPESATSLERDDVEQFLIYFIRRNDLLIPESESSWLLLASASSAQTSSFLDRMKADRDKLNRNRPRGPIPDFSIECVRVEAIDAEPRMILQEFHPCSEPSENRYATC